jgi:ubiquinone/menaquinone biosynthesis C-methylase UbiE
VTDIAERADPTAIWRIINGFGAYFAAVAAVRLGVFDALQQRPLDAAQLAEECGADRARLAPLCDVLAGIGLLRRGDDEYALTPESEAFLTTTGPRSMRELLLRSPGPWENWPVLDETIRGGPPPHLVDAPFYEELVPATFPTQFAVARSVAESIGSVTNVLDLGAGAAPWAIALLLANPHARATLNDLPPVLDIARANARTYGVDQRCEFVAGDYFDLALPPAAFDAVVFGHVLRAEGLDGARRLFDCVLPVLRPGGLVIVADYFVEDDHRGPINALLLGVTMTASTRTGSTLTYGECRELLAAAGVDDVELLQPMPSQEVMIGRTARRTIGETT